MQPFRLGTRSSPLALWQANHVRDLLQPAVGDRAIELVHIETHGDRDQIQPLAAMGGFGVFTKAIQQALLDNRCDAAVHSLKDLPTIAVPGLQLAATPKRASIGDAFLSTRHISFESLPEGATVATSSLRRRSMILNRRPDLKLIEMRGNIDTRLRKLQEQEIDGMVLAQAGLDRLGLSQHIVEVLNPTWMLPAVGQGAIGLECRSDDGDTKAILSLINHEPTWAAILAERACLSALGGGCLVPIGTFSQFEDGQLSVRGMVLSPDGKRRISATERGPINKPLGLGNELAATLMDLGAAEILQLSSRT
jgi:hydroxymethylbilane synthase